MLSYCLIEGLLASMVMYAAVVVEVEPLFAVRS